MLHRSGAEFLADFHEIGLTYFAVIMKNAYLDEFVTIEAARDFMQNGLAETVLANGNQRVEGMGAGAQGAALFGSNFEHGEYLDKGCILQGLAQ